ncbi:heme-degrading domain-containing protein [Flavihumibacter sp. UBA7668]|uniref:heme-degrading domain-containing protein n=1 Tax=Flavihumibacter sp. UBA7668 TaxID=1946542 RepID=UPI0025BF5127|nr:heme-binding protein [Flavihumibacter sp. UBA7668]
METNTVLKRIELKQFSNRLALEMGLAIIELVKNRNQIIGVEIARLNQPVFLYIDESLPVDKHHWIKRKANTAKHFEESSLSVRFELERKNRSLEQFYGLNENEYVAKGGAIPLFVDGAGLIGIITVTGLPDTDDHQLIIDALQGRFF